MGQALIMRRGSAVKRGTIANVEAYKLSDPALIGARNAVLLETRTIYGGIPSTIVIENGSVVSVACGAYDFSHERSGCLFVNDPDMSFDGTTGEITVPVKNNGFESYYEYEFYGHESESDEMIAAKYDYIIFN